MWQLWTVASIVAAVAFCGLATRVEAPSLPAAARPVLFGFTVITLFVFRPMLNELNDGQVDTFVLASLAASTLVSQRGRKFAAGAFVGLAALMKTWPGVVALGMFSRSTSGRVRMVSGFATALLMAPVLALLVGGWSGLIRLVSITFDSGAQHLPSYSAWGIPKLMFSPSGLARPILVSTPLEVVSMLVLAAWLAFLIVLNLRGGRDYVLTFWNVTACMVLLLPVSHYAYTLYLLPLLWIWAARSLSTPTEKKLVLLTTATLILWWLVSVRFGPVFSAQASSLRYAVTFAANLIAVSVSSLGGHFGDAPRRAPLLQ